LEFQYPTLIIIYIYINTVKHGCRCCLKKHTQQLSNTTYLIEKTRRGKNGQEWVWVYLFAIFKAFGMSFWDASYKLKMGSKISETNMGLKAASPPCLNLITLLLCFFLEERNKKHEN
jgi:hypothetical protein